MSTGEVIRLDEAHAVATELVGLLADHCERIEIAGSIRRRKGEVHDIEVVAIPRVEETRGGLWGEDVERVDRLQRGVMNGIDLGYLEVRQVESHRRDGTVSVGARFGPSYKALVYRGMPVDLFITTPEQWGCIFALRTGPGDWNERLVTDCKRFFRSVSGGRVLHFGKALDTPEEADFFRALAVPWVDPWDRRVETLRFDPELLREDLA